MTLLTAWRRHPFEMLLTNLVVFIGVFHLLLGVPTRDWMPLAAGMACLQALQHSQLDWGYGPIGRWVVSPHFHAFHHSVDRRHTNANFGMMFSCWDYLFCALRSPNASGREDETRRPPALGGADSRHHPRHCGPQCPVGRKNLRSPAQDRPSAPGCSRFDMNRAQELLLHILAR